MALITLRRNLCHLSDFRMHGALAALRSQPVSHVHKVAKKRLRPRSCPLHPGPFEVRFHHACCKEFHSENGNDLRPVGEALLSDRDSFEQNLENVDERVFYRSLSSFTSSEEVLSFLSTLRTLPDTLAAGALRRISDLERTADAHRPRREILENRVFQALCVQFEREPSHLSNAGLVTALHALTLLYAEPQRSLVLNLLAECQRRLRRGGLEVHSLCVLGETLVKLQGPDSATLDLILYQLQGEELENFAPEDVVALYRVLQACSEKADRHQALLNRMNNLSLSLVPSLSPTSMSQVLAALVALDQTQALPLVIKLGKHAVRHVPRFTSEELGRVLEAFVYFGHHDRFFTTALEQHVASLCLTLDPDAVGRVIEYCSRKHILSRPILDVVAETLVCQAEKFSPRQVAELIEPFGKLNYLPPNASALFRKLEDVLSAHFNAFPPKTLLRLLHSCSLIERHPVNFMAKIFSPYFLQRLQGEESSLDRLSLAQLTQLLLTSLLECPFYKGPRLHPKHQVKSFLTPCCSLETPADFQLYKSIVAALMDLLGARLYFASKVLTRYCYTIDVEIKLDEEGFVLPLTADEDVHRRIALCVDGPKRFCLNSRHLLGKEATKQRHLRLLGYQVVQIPYYEIETLTRLELVEYLQRKLFSPNAGVCW